MDVFSWELAFFRVSSGQSKLRTSGAHCTNASTLFIFGERDHSRTCWMDMMPDFKLLRDGLETASQSWSYWLEESLVSAPHPWPEPLAGLLRAFYKALPLWCMSHRPWSWYLSRSLVKVSVLPFLGGFPFAHCAYDSAMQTPEPSCLPTDRGRDTGMSLKPHTVSDYLGPCPFGVSPSPLPCLRW